MNYPWIEGPTQSPIVEFRRDKLRPGQRDRLIALFEEKLIEPQEEVGAQVLGSFRVAGAPDSFVWLRGFEHMRHRQMALESFYGSPVWRANGAAANAAVLDDRDAYLLRAVAPIRGLPASLRSSEAEAAPAAPLLALLSDVRFAEGVGNYHNWLRLFLRKEGLDPLASFVTFMATNNFPALPLSQDRALHVALMRFSGHIPELPPELRQALRQRPEFMILHPTTRSLLR